MIYCVSQQLPPLIIVEGNWATLAPLLEGGVRHTSWHFFHQTCQNWLGYYYRNLNLHYKYFQDICFDIICLDQVVCLL